MASIRDMEVMSKPGYNDPLIQVMLTEMKEPRRAVLIYRSGFVTYRNNILVSQIVRQEVSWFVSLTSAYRQNSSRKVLIISNATIASASFCHEITIPSGVRHRTRCGFCVIANKPIYSGVASIWFFYSPSLLTSNEEEWSANNRCQTNNTNHYTCSNAGCVWTTTTRSARGRSCSLARSRHNNGVVSLRNDRRRTRRRWSSIVGLGRRSHGINSSGTTEQSKTIRPNTVYIIPTT